MLTEDEASNILVEQAGQLHGAIVKGILDYLRSDTDARNAIQADALMKLVARDVISESEKSELTELTATMIQKDQPIASSLGDVQRTKGRNLKLSALMKVLMGVAEDSLSTPGTNGPIAHADVEGGIVGAILRAEVSAIASGGAGTISGAVAGGVIGGAAAFVATWL